MQKHKKYFDLHAKVNTFHFTTDGQAFENKNHAENHQKRLTGKSEDVKTIHRRDLKEETTKEPVKPATDTKEGTGEKDSTKEQDKAAGKDTEVKPKA